MNKMTGYFLRSLLFTAFALLFSCNSRDSNNSGEITLDALELSDLSGKEIDPDEFDNKTVFINFWATWCKPCIQEMPTIENAQAHLRGKNVIFLLASNESIEQIETFKKSRRFHFRYVKIKNLEDLHIQALPTTCIFNQQGELVFSEAGFRMWDSPKNINLIKTHSKP